MSTLIIKLSNVSGEFDLFIKIDSFNDRLEM